MTSLLLFVLALPATFAPEKQEEPEQEVLQLVTFELLPGKTREAIELFRNEALPLYETNTPMLRFRGYREAESPLPLDLMVVSTFRGMAGMDASNRALRDAAQKAGTTVGELYGRIAALSEHHRDDFLENNPELGWGSIDGSKLVVFVSIQLLPARGDDYASLVRERIAPWEKTLAPGVSGAVGGPMLVSDGWSYMRILAIDSLGEWHRYLRESRRQTWSRELDAMVAAVRPTILVPLPELSVR